MINFNFSVMDQYIILFPYDDDDNEWVKMKLHNEYLSQIGFNS